MIYLGIATAAVGLVYDLGISSAGTDDARRMAFNRAKKGLIAQELVGVWEEHVWPQANAPC